MKSIIEWSDRYVNTVCRINASTLFDTYTSCKCFTAAFHFGLSNEIMTHTGDENPTRSWRTGAHIHGIVMYFWSQAGIDIMAVTSQGIYSLATEMTWKRARWYKEPLCNQSITVIMARA